LNIVEQGLASDTEAILRIASEEVAGDVAPNVVDELEERKRLLLLLL